MRWPWASSPSVTTTHHSSCSRAGRRCSPGPTRSASASPPAGAASCATTCATAASPRRRPDGAHLHPARPRRRRRGPCRRTRRRPRTPRGIGVSGMVTQREPPDRLWGVERRSGDVAPTSPAELPLRRLTRAVEGVEGDDGRDLARVVERPVDRRRTGRVVRDERSSAGSTTSKSAASSTTTRCATSSSPSCSASSRMSSVSHSPSAGQCGHRTALSTSL